MELALLITAILIGAFFLAGYLIKRDKRKNPEKYIRITYGGYD